MPTISPYRDSWHDPFDLWAVPSLGRIKLRWYQGSRTAKLALFGLYALDWLAPMTMRRLLGVKPNRFAHSQALLRNTGVAMESESFVALAEELRQDNAWGLPFCWFSKNGVYPAGMPLVTAAPYVCEALLDIRGDDEVSDKARSLFHDSWHFLQALHVHEDRDGWLALSYAPFDDTVTVINANSYAAWLYALHAVHGLPERRADAVDRARKLALWVVDNQNPDGSWFYLAQRGDWDMIDGFHSCFVVRNLHMAGALVPEIGLTCDGAIRSGWTFIRENLFDRNAGLCRRYVTSHRADPFRFDIYDQAEYLGLLIDFGLLDEAQTLAHRVEQIFVRKGHWYCRKDIFGRLWGRDFFRWGIVPFLHHRARLEKALADGAA